MLHVDNLELVPLDDPCLYVPMMTPGGQGPGHGQTLDDSCDPGPDQGLQWAGPGQGL